MSDFTIPHLAVGQANVSATSVKQCVGIFAKQPVIGGLAGKCNRVGLGFGTIPPAIEDDENERFGTGHLKNLPWRHKRTEKHKAV
jgi:hypothetical protein